jgi:cell division protein FtsW
MKKTLTTLALTVVILLGLGIVLLATASTVRAQGLYADPHFFFKRQLMWLGLAAAVAFVSCRFDYHWWKKIPLLPVAFYACVVIALVLVFCPVIGGKVKGSCRWLNLGPLRMQPSEFAKIAIVVVMSVWMDRIGWRVRQFVKGALIPAGALGVFAALLAVEPDFGATMVVIVLGGSLMFVTGSRIWHLLVIACAGLPPLILLIATNANRMERIRAWLQGSDSDSSAAYHLQQAILAFKNGGPWGVGFNQSIQKYNYLPEAHTDFIFAIGGEEFGFLFSIGVLLAFAVLLVCGILISIRAPDRLGRLLAFGMTLLLVFQAAFNIGMVTGCLPTKGLALPFISYGGTNLITALFAVGTLINVGLHIDVFDERLHTQVVRNAVKQI